MPNTPKHDRPHHSGHEKFSFRCADAGFQECTWQTQGTSQEEVLRNAEQHGREKHHLARINEDTRNKVRSKIRRAA